MDKKAHRIGFPFSRVAPGCGGKREGANGKSEFSEQKPQMTNVRRPVTILPMPEIWKKCASCKKDILCGQSYYVCSVSTCQGRTTNYAFCSIPCWDAHIPVERHKGDSAGALERKAPATPAAAEPERSPKRVIANAPAGQKSGGEASVEDEILVVVTKVRKYIADKSGGMNTSAGVYEALTERIKRICDRAIETARSQGRKTVMDRDVP